MITFLTIVGGIALVGVAVLAVCIALQLKNWNG